MAFALAGLRVSSEFALPGVARWDNDAQGEEVVIRRAAVPENLPSAIARFTDGAWNGVELLLTIRGAARYLVTHSRIDVDPLNDADPGDVSAYLLGTVFAALCHQRGILPLHASAIELSDGCAAFAGDSGAGKSTIVAGLAERGHQLISDDVTYVRAARGGGFDAWPGSTRLRLWESAMDGLGYDKQGAEREFRGYDKYLVSSAAPRAPAAQRQLRCIFLLEPAPEGSATTIEQVKGTAAIEALLLNTYRLYLAEHIGRKGHVFAACAQGAQTVPVFRLSRPMDFRVLPSVLDDVEMHLKCG